MNKVKLKRIGCSPYLEGEIGKVIRVTIMIDIPRQLWVLTVEGGVNSWGKIYETSSPNLWEVINACQKQDAIDIELEFDEDLIDESIEFAGSSNYGSMGKKKISPSEAQQILDRTDGQKELIQRMINSKSYDAESVAWLKEKLKKSA